MSHRAPSYALLVVSFWLSSGCSVLLDTDNNQCSKRSDCAGLVGGTTTQLCVRGFCERVACASTADCRAMTDDAKDPFAASYCDPETLSCEPKECSQSADCGDGSFCAVDEGRCVSGRLSCKADADCALYDAPIPLVCESGACVQGECTKNEDCADLSEGAACVEGRCSDVTWGCVGEPDDREIPQKGTATLKLRVLSLIGDAPIPSLVAKACGVQADPECTMPIPGAVTEYDTTTGWLTVKGLQQGARVRLAMEADNLLSVDWYTQRSIVGEVVEEQPASMVPVGTASILGNQFKPPIVVDLANKGTATIRAKDCEGKPAEGVSLTVTKPLEDTKIFYLNESNQILLDAQETTSYGAGGIANMRAEPIRISLTRGGRTLSEFDFTPRTNRLTNIVLYPRKY